MTTLTTLPDVNLAFSQIATVMGGTANQPISLSQYYSNLPLTAGVADIPGQGSAISLSSFRGKSKGAPGFIYGSTVLMTRHQGTVDTLLPGKTLSLLFRASRDGFTASAFHAKCNGNANVFVVLKSTTHYVASAYSSVAFTSSGNFVAAPLNSCWLNALESSGGTLSSVKFLNNADAAESICDISTYGPIFGGGFDLMVPNRFDVNPGSCATALTTYKAMTPTSLFGVADFLLSELEVYKAAAPAQSA